MKWRQLAIAPAALGGALFFYHLGSRSWGWVALGAGLALCFSVVWIGVPLPWRWRRSAPTPPVTHPINPPGKGQHVGPGHRASHQRRNKAAPPAGGRAPTRPHNSRARPRREPRY